jgi:hypothetical protein
MNGSGKMRPVETILRMGSIKNNDEGGEFNLDIL